MDHFCSCQILILIAFLKLFAAAALHVINMDKGNYSVINKATFPFAAPYVWLQV
jgi:hypothetical protein